jgi:hypothetical protein
MTIYAEGAALTQAMARRIAGIGKDEFFNHRRQGNLRGILPQQEDAARAVYTLPHVVALRLFVVAVREMGVSGSVFGDAFTETSFEDLSAKMRADFGSPPLINGGGDHAAGRFAHLFMVIETEQLWAGQGFLTRPAHFRFLHSIEQTLRDTWNDGVPKGTATATIGMHLVDATAAFLYVQNRLMGGAATAASDEA